MSSLENLDSTTLRNIIESRINNIEEEKEPKEALISLYSDGNVGWFVKRNNFDEGDIECSIKISQYIFELLLDPKLLYIIHLYFSKTKPELYNKNQLW